METVIITLKQQVTTVAALALLSSACAPPMSAPGDGLGALIDRIFSDVATGASPGGTVAVIRDGALLYSAGYGLAQLEHHIPNTPDTIFHVASVSKQFTAMAVTLLAADGVLSLDDRVQTHLDYVPDLGRPVALRQLMHHTSGVRDQWELLALAGWRLDDVITTDHVTGLMARQQELNFEPNSEYLYSNMGYTLLAETVRTASGMSFPEFTEARIFAPLGMTRTHFHDDHEHAVEGRAYSYTPADGAGFEKSVLSYANAGATSLFTTAEDLARWLDNFRHEMVGGPDVMALMRTRGALNGGETIDYARGLAIGEYRGLTTIGHSGGDAGFRSQVVWFPEADTGVVVLMNHAGGNPGRRALRVADAVLEELLKAAEDEIEEPDGAVIGSGTRADAFAPSQDELGELAGTYYSPEVEALYRLEVAGDELTARHVRHGVIALTPVVRDEFASDEWFLSTLRFERNAEANVVGFRASGGRVRNLRFVRLTTPLPD